jgi:hypothetical protein
MWYGGAWEGVSSGSGEPGNGYGGYSQNLVNIAYAINNMTPGLTYANQPYMSSNPLSSRHTGGVHATKADGSVIFLSENINFLTLLNLADIKDEIPLGEY